MGEERREERWERGGSGEGVKRSRVIGGKVVGGVVRWGGIGEDCLRDK